MRIIKLAEPGWVDCIELEKPVPDPGQALIRIKTAGICGSDIDALRGASKLVSHPRIIGHELAGIIERIPADNPKGLKVKDKVIVSPYLYCGTCYPCNIGYINCYTDLKVLGVRINEGMVEYYCHLAGTLVKVPEDMDWADAAMTEPLAISLHGIHKGGLRTGECCTVIDTGPVGLLVGMITRAYGVRAILLDLVREHLDFMRELGTKYVVDSEEENLMEHISEITGGAMAQQVVGYSSAGMTMLQTLDPVSHTGRITLTGRPPKETPILTGVITRKEIDIRGACISAEGSEETIGLICTKKMGVTKILTKTVGLEEVPRTTRGIKKNLGNYVKVVVKMD